MAFQLLAEVLAGLEGVETGGEVALFVAKPAAPEGLQGLQLQVLVLNLTPLDQDLLLQLLVDKDVGRLMLQRRLQRLFELVFGAGAGGSVGRLNSAGSSLPSRDHRTQTTISQADGFSICG